MARRSRNESDSIGQLAFGYLYIQVSLFHHKHVVVYNRPTMSKTSWCYFMTLYIQIIRDDTVMKNLKTNKNILLLSTKDERICGFYVYFYIFMDHGLYCKSCIISLLSQNSLSTESILFYTGTEYFYVKFVLIYLEYN